MKIKQLIINIILKWIDSFESNIIDNKLLDRISEPVSVDRISEPVSIEIISEKVSVKYVVEQIIVPVSKQVSVEPVEQTLGLPIYFSQFYGPLGIHKFIEDKTECKPNSRSRITYLKYDKTCILQADEIVYYYADDLSDINNIKFTLAGKSCNQNENNKENHNKQLLSINKTKKIYVYSKNERGYFWYGKYVIVDRNNKLHIGEDHENRNIIVLTLRRLSN